jgi:hypothetical protein
MDIKLIKLNRCLPTIVVWLANIRKEREKNVSLLKYSTSGSVIMVYKVWIKYQIRQNLNTSIHLQFIIT